MHKGSSAYSRQDEMMMAINLFYDVTHPLKRKLLYILSFIFVTVLFSWIVTWNFSQFMSTEMKNGSFTFTFILLGTVHVFIARKRLPHIYKRPGKRSIVFTLLLASAVALVAYLLFLLMAYDNLLLALTAAAAFLLPSLIGFGWLYFNALFSETHSPFDVWFVNDNTEAPPGRKVAAFLANLPVRIQLKAAYYDIREITCDETVAPRATLGKSFSEFLNKKSATQRFELTDEHLQPYGWQFYLQQFIESIPLNPDANLIDNNVQPGDTIIAERVKKS